MKNIISNIKNLRIFKVELNTLGNYVYKNIMKDDNSLKSSMGKVTIQFDDQTQVVSSQNGFILDSQALSSNGGSFTLEMAKFPSERTLRALYDSQLTTNNTTLFGRGNRAMPVLFIQFDLISEGCNASDLSTTRIRIPYCIPNFINIQPKAMMEGVPANNGFLIDGIFTLPLDPTWQRIPIEIVDLDDEEINTTLRFLQLERYIGPRIPLVAIGKDLHQNYKVIWVNSHAFHGPGIIDHTLKSEVWANNAKIADISLVDTLGNLESLGPIEKNISISNSENFHNHIWVYWFSGSNNNDGWFNGMSDNIEKILLIQKPIFTNDIQDWLDNQYNL